MRISLAQTLFATVVLAQAASLPPVPIWSGEGQIPQRYGNRRVFLTPDEHSVILMWPNPDGDGSKPRRLPLHNVIDPELRVRIESHSNAFVYTYDLENTKQSEDSINTFSIVVYPDSNLHAGGQLWRAMKSTAIVGKRIGIPNAPDGGLVLWNSPETQPLAPGDTTRFKLISSARPGFTTAATEHYPHLDLTDEWPAQILDELEPVLTPHWIDQHIITLGPRYGPEATDSQTASDYLVGIHELIRQHRMEQTSPFVQHVMAYLEKVAHGASSVPFAVNTKPQSEIEIEILTALQLALHSSGVIPVSSTKLYDNSARHQRHRYAWVAGYWR